MRRTPSSTHTSTLMPYTTLFRSQETLILCTDTLCQFRDHCSPDVLGPFSLPFSFSRLARLTRVRQAQSSTTPRRMGNNGQPTISSPHNLLAYRAAAATEHCRRRGDMLRHQTTAHHRSDRCAASLPCSTQ